MGKQDFVFVDGNLETDPWKKIIGFLDKEDFSFFACTVMPGPQLEQAVAITKKIKQQFPDMVTIWGGYFASLHYRICMESGVIDYIIRGPGDATFPKLIEYLQNGKENLLTEIGNLVSRSGDKVQVNPMDAVPDQDSLPGLPYAFLNRFYSLENYIVKTFIGNRTLSYHSSIGCPHNCEFCGVASLYQSTWKGKSAKKMAAEILDLKSRYHIDAIEFHDSNFFCSHSRTLEFCSLMKGQNIQWWAEGRVDTMNRYSDEELKLIRESGCRLVFMGAETGNDSLLRRINKGASFKAADTAEITGRFRETGIIPELSFVLGLPDITPQKTVKQIREDIRFVRRLKKINPETEVVLYLFSPVPAEGSDLFTSAEEKGFRFPATLEEWLTDDLKNIDLRRGSGIPWLSRSVVKLIRNFEVVMTAAFPGKSNFQLSRFDNFLLKIPGKFRYHLRWYFFPIEIKALLRFLSYLKPQKEGFYSK